MRIKLLSLPPYTKCDSLFGTILYGDAEGFLYLRMDGFVQQLTASGYEYVDVLRVLQSQIAFLNPPPIMTYAPCGGCLACSNNRACTRPIKVDLAKKES